MYNSIYGSLFSCDDWTEADTVTKLVWPCLIGHPQRNTIGIIRSSAEMLANDINEDVGDVERALYYYQDKGMIIYDKQKSIIGLVNHFRYKADQTTSSIKSWTSSIDSIPKCEARDFFVKKCITFYKTEVSQSIKNRIEKPKDRRRATNIIEELTARLPSDDWQLSDNSEHRTGAKMLKEKEKEKEKEKDFDTSVPWNFRGKKTTRGQTKKKSKSDPKRDTEGHKKENMGTERDVSQLEDQINTKTAIKKEGSQVASKRLSEQKQKNDDKYNSSVKLQPGKYERGLAEQRANSESTGQVNTTSLPPRVEESESPFNKIGPYQTKSKNDECNKIATTKHLVEQLAELCRSLNDWDDYILPAGDDLVRVVSAINILGYDKCRDAVCGHHACYGGSDNMRGVRDVWHAFPPAYRDGRRRIREFDEAKVKAFIREGNGAFDEYQKKRMVKIMLRKKMGPRGEVDYKNPYRPKFREDFLRIEQEKINAGIKPKLAQEQAIAEANILQKELWERLYKEEDEKRERKKREALPPDEAKKRLAEIRALLDDDDEEEEQDDKKQQTAN